MKNQLKIERGSMVYALWCIFIIGICVFSCNKIYNLGENEIEKNFNHIELEPEYIPELTFREDRYVPAYSNLYYKSESTYIYCTVILSIRNTSLTEDLYLNNVDYYDTYGNALKSFVEKKNKIRPLETREFIVDFKDQEGGSGANFIVSYGAKDELKDLPIIESITIGHHGNNGFTFTSNSQVIQSI